MYYNTHIFLSFLDGDTTYYLHIPIVTFSIQSYIIYLYFNTLRTGDADLRF